MNTKILGVSLLPASVFVFALGVTMTGVAQTVAAGQRQPLLATGTPAPDFEAEAWTGGLVHLSDFKGKVVVLDFWADWCGPCRSTMPHIEKVYQATKDQGVVVLGVCVWEDKESYAKWVTEKKDVYHYPVAFDPAGKTSDQSIASTKYNVTGIPTTYLIDKDGNVVMATVGYKKDDKRLEEALGKLGVSTTPPIVEMTEELMARLIKYTRSQKESGSTSSKLGKVLGLCDGTSDLPLKLAKSDSTEGEHYLGLPLDPQSGDILILVKQGPVIEAYLTNAGCTLRAAAVLEDGAAHLVLNEQAEQKFQAELALFAGEASAQLPPSEATPQPAPEAH